LFHQPIAVWVRMAFGPKRGEPLLTAGLKYGGTLVASLVLSLIIASLVYRFFSLPLLRRGREKHRANTVPTAIETSKAQPEALRSAH
jgi:peptidoglycan/LPS O-acetylase OafA/YrhL